MTLSLPVRDCISGSELGLPLVDFVRTLRSHESTRLSWHEHACCELMVGIEGATAYEIKGGGTCELRRGCFIFIPAGVIHRGAHDARSPVALCGIQFDPHRGNALGNASIREEELALIRQRVRESGVAVCACNRGLKNSIDQLIAEKDQRFAGTGPNLVWAVLRSLVCQIIVEAAQLLGGQEQRQEQIYVSAAKEFLTQRLREPFSVEELVKRLGISRTRLFTVFKAETGLTPNDFLIRYRVEEAQRLLIETDRPITEIAFDLGFNSSQYFSRVFLRYTGHSPRNFRHGL